MIAPHPHVIRRGTGAPMLFLHGNGVDHRMALDLDDVFDEQTPWERIYLDLPGFGETPALEGPGGLPEVADWLDAAVNELIGSTPFAVVGTSLGGLLARELAARRKEQCLGFALLATVVDPVRDNRTLPEPTVLVTDTALVESLDPADAAEYTWLAVVQSRENWERFRRTVLPGLRAADQAAMERLDARYALPELPDSRLAGYDRPVLIVAGRQDAVVGFVDQWELSLQFPRATFAMLDRAGHNIQVDQPETVHELLGRWASDVVDSPVRV